MSADDIIKLLDSIASYVEYIYPGYITIYTYFFFKAKTLKDEKGVVVKSVVISFLYKTFLAGCTFSSIEAYHSMLIFLSVLVAYFAYWLQTLDETNNFLEFFGIHTRFEDQAIDLLDNGEISAWVRVYLRNEKIMYEGFLGPRELEEGKINFIILKKFRKYELDDIGEKKGKSLAEYKTDDDQVLIFREDIKRIEKENI